MNVISIRFVEIFYENYSSLMQFPVRESLQLHNVTVLIPIRKKNLKKGHIKYTNDVVPSQWIPYFQPFG